MTSLTRVQLADSKAHLTESSSAGTRRLVVVFVIDNMGYGGTELNAVRTAERLDSRRFDLRVICLSNDGPLSERYRARGIPVESLRLRNFYGPSMLSAGLRFVRYLRHENVDIVHAHDVYSNIFATLWARIAHVPVVIASRRWWHSLPSLKLRLGNRLAFPFADAVLANSVQVARTVLQEGLPPERIWTVPNFADDDAFSRGSNVEREGLRSDWHVPEDAVVLGCVARLDPVKDHATLLKAFALMHERYPHTYLVLIGDGPVRAELESLINELSLSDAVYLTGELRTGRNYHQGVDISVLASTSEGFPNSLVEAMAAGSPVVATAVGGTIDAVAHEETGLLVPPGDPPSLANAMSRLVADGKLRRRFGDAGMERARQRYSASRVIVQVETMYQQLRNSTSVSKDQGTSPRV